MSSKGANDISVLRLGHRRERDKRITSHLGLTARAFGADKIILCGEEDKSPLETWSSVTSRFGGNFDCYYEPKPLKFLRNISKEKSSTIVHLTMYGEELEKTISKIPLLGNILVGKKIGEGGFGVSFKIKGPPKKLKTTVNPIKTLTPRFITRTLEKLKRN